MEMKDASYLVDLIDTFSDEDLMKLSTYVRKVIRMRQEVRQWTLIDENNDVYTSTADVEYPWDAKWEKINDTTTEDRRDNRVGEAT